MPNRPEFMALWLGVTRIGGVVALINTNLTGAALAHCINVVAPKHIVVAAELFDFFETARDHIDANARIWLHGDADANFARIDREVDAFSGAPLTAAEERPLTIEDRALYIYTSGTTGLPKAANINHYRMMLASHAFAGVMDTKPSDRMYDCLPMYHTAGGLVATGALLINGGSVVLRDSFSAREFWDDLVRWDCTLFQYIGELCRYLLNSPHNPKERSHRLRLACGNGLRPDVWPEFQHRFRIPQIVEFYARDRRQRDAVQFRRQGRRRRTPARGIVGAPLSHQDRRIRHETRRSRCATSAASASNARSTSRAKSIGKILKDAAKPGARFEGYASDAETDKKILRDVFEKGDVWFRTGDLMRKDENGYFYFVDRIGDTFRWKGENVSTTEVEHAILAFEGVLEANVYGVSVPGRDGRAGMAAIVVEDHFNLTSFRDHLAKRLPDYARPVFLRLRQDSDLTSTFKQKKVDLAKQGFDPGTTADPLYFNDPAAGAFVPLDAALYGRIVAGDLRL